MVTDTTIKKIKITGVKNKNTNNNISLDNLSQLPQPVKEIYYRGDFINLLKKPKVAIVGSRKVTSYGQAVTIKLAASLARAGVVIVSGLALGVDSIAHKAALDAGGLTIAVLPTGLDKIYPASHYNLANQMVKQGGALISEYPVGQGSPQKWQFIARNRIIAALSQGVIITEAAARSGSLHTANFALEQGIDVFAIPGNVTSKLSEGTNNLIKSGAHCVTNGSDILETLGITISSNKDSAKQKSFESYPLSQRILLEIINREPISQSDLILKSKLDVSLAQQSLTMLEIEGVIKRDLSGNWTSSL